MSSPVQRACFVAMAGLPGAGKSALAEALAERLGGVVLSKDRVRAALFPAGTTDYSQAQDDFCMSVILEATQRIAAARRVPFIFFDGRTFWRTRQVQQIAEAAAAAGAELRILHLHCPDALALERIAKDRDQHPAGNRNAELYFRVKSHFEPITLPKLDVDTSRPLEECVAKCIKFLTTETQKH